MKHVTDYPKEVREAYEIIEQLLPSEDYSPIAEHNRTTESVLLYLLDSLYQAVPGEPKF